MSNLTGRLTQTGEIDAAYWRRHAREPVRFQQGIETLTARGCEIFVEIGPTPVLTGMGRACVPQGIGVWLPTLRKGRGDWEQVLASLGELYVRGVEVDWAASTGPTPGGRSACPPTRSSGSGTGMRMRTSTAGRQIPRPPPRAVLHPLLGHRVRAAHRDRLFENQVGVGATAYLRDHAFYGQPVFPAARRTSRWRWRRERRGRVGRRCSRRWPIEQPLFLPEGKAPTVQCVVSEDGGFEVVQPGGRGGGALATTRDGAGGRHGARGAGPRPRHRAGGGGLDAARARCQQPLEVSAYYERFRALGVEYGPAFRGIEAVWSGDGEAVGASACRRPPATRPAIGCTRPSSTPASRCWARRMGATTAAATCTCRPHLKRFTVVGEVGRRAWAHAVVQAEPGRPLASPARSGSSTRPAAWWRRWRGWNCGG